MMKSGTPATPTSPDAASADAVPCKLAAQINRRTALLGTASLLLSCTRGYPSSDNTLFWRVTPQGRKGAVLFGYARVAASSMADDVKLGEALVAGCERIVMDMPQRIVFPAINLGQEKPLVQSLSPQLAYRLRATIARTTFASVVDRLGSIAINTLLIGEGQHNERGLPGSGGTSPPSIGGTIVDYGRSLGKPIDQVLSDAEVQSQFSQIDIPALQSAAGNSDAISYLLDLRDRIGPIGAYFENQYRQGNVEEIARLGEDLSRHGLTWADRLMHADRLRDLWLERAWNVLTEQSDERRFILLPAGELGGQAGALVAFKNKGAAVAPVTGRGP